MGIFSNLFKKRKPKNPEDDFIVTVTGTFVRVEHPQDTGRNMKINSTEMASFLKKLGWSTFTVLTLQQMLSNASCKYISSDDDYIHLHYGTGDVCSFWYIISKRPFADSTIEKDSKAGVAFLRNNVRIGASCAL